MRPWMRVWAALAFFLAFATIAAAQDARVAGQVLDRDGKPWPGVTVEIKSDVGRVFTVKTDKDGKFSQLGLNSGVYTITYSLPPELNYVTQKQISSGQDNDASVNFKQVLAQQQANPEQQKAREEAANAFKNMKAHVDAGDAALSDADEIRKQLKAAPADQKSALQDKLNTDYQTAITELQAAEQGVGPKDGRNHAIILSNLGIAQNLAGHYDDSAASYQKAIELNPQAGYYAGLSQALANSAAMQTDPAAVAAKIADAGANCDKVTALDPAPATTARCWRNIGIVLTNKGNLKDAIGPLQKATAADPKDAQGWYLLGSAYTGTIDTKQEGDKMTYIIPPGTADSYQKCIDADPAGPYAAQCKTMLDSLAAMAGGDIISTGTKKSTSKKK
ncbi:MAG TPA: carboxypeptidase regulatory-like domain-containing protein [Verrucomicrobiae bacterium]|nr:carboxypeptidase regulatory-like domain-containing protein [Verrucomicrobiae bacterium]